MLTSLQNTWRNLTLVQRVALLGILAVVFGGVLMIATTAGRPAYGTLGENLDPEDARAIVERLRELKVDYRLGNGGRTIEVPQEKVDEMLLEVNSGDLPSGGNLGLGKFEKSEFVGMTKDVFNVRYRVGLESDLARVLKRLDGIQDAHVKLALTEKPVFGGEEDPVKASVVLQLRPGYHPTERQIKGVTGTIVGSVERLRPENVNIIDSKQNPLSVNGVPTEASNSRIGLQNAIEKSLAGKLQEAADEVLGPKKSKITVSVDLDFDQTETNKEEYTPSNPDKKSNLASKAKKIDEELVKTGSGAAPSVLSSANAGKRSVPGTYKSSQDESDFVVNKSVEKRVVTPGKVRLISVAAFIDEAAKLGEAREQKLKRNLAAAAGLDLKRGDQIELMSIPFDQSVVQNAAREAADASKKEFQTTMLRNGAAVLLTLLVAGFTLLMVRRPRRTIRVTQIDTTIGEGPETPTLNGSEIPALEAPPTGTVDEAPFVAEEEIPVAGTPLERLQQLATDQPEEVARLLRTWIRTAA